ncbi:MAG: carbon-nitrogen hydrolase family protein [Gammaproteobacteria bacterium]|nr:carbon-nitrogen hydrolase family protein [Gammaproteobacteria bacterium]
MSNKPVLAAIQMTSGPELAGNLKVAGEWLQRAAGEGASLAVLPEYFARLGLPERDRVASAETFGRGPVQDFLAETAAREKLWIVGGSLPLQGEASERAYGSCLVYDDAGTCRGRYDKRYLFDVALPDSDEQYAESEWTIPGEGTAVIDTPFGRLGLAICYDLRFPELFRAEAAEGVDFFALPAAFTTTTGEAHWETLLRARAIENQALVVAAAQVGTHPNGRRTHGHSLVVDAWGRVLADAGDQPGLVLAEFDTDRQADIRRRFPALEHRRH